MIRPGAPLLQSLIAEERRGRPRAAQIAARAAAKADEATEHLLDVVYALLIAGEPRAAARELDELERAQPDADIERRIYACRSWADQYDRNWYPGDTGAEREEGTLLTLESAATGDPETILLEACVADGPPPLLAARAVIDSVGRQGSPALSAVRDSAMRTLQRLAAIAKPTGADTVALWAEGAAADVSWRSGLQAQAAQMLDHVREGYAQRGDSIGLAGTYLLEGDWYAVPGSSPEALGFDLAQQHLASPLAGVKDPSRAVASYERAKTLLVGLDVPRMSGALALRRAALFWAEERFDEQRDLLAEANRAFADAGDAAGLQVVAIHRLLADLASGEIAATRLLAGTGWDHRARGPVADVLAWADSRGSASFGTGLGRLMQRAGEAWDDAGDPERAAVAYSMALPLVGLAGGVMQASVLDALAGVDSRRNLLARSLVRLEQTMRALPPVTAIVDNPRPWMQQVNLVTAMVGAQSSRAGGSAAGFGVSGLERAISRLTELAAVPGVPSSDAVSSLMRDAPELLDQLARAHAHDDAEGLLDESINNRLVAITAQMVRDAIANMTPMIARYRGQLAQRAGWSAEADRWFATALDAVDADIAEHGWIGALVCAAWGREEEALSRFEEVQERGLLRDDLLALLALRVRAYETAKNLFATIDASRGDTPLTWDDLADRAELDLEVGKTGEALKHATIAIERFESILATLGRDPDRLAMCDRLQASSLYLTASRAQIAIAEACENMGDYDGRTDALDRSFESSDRARSLTLASLVAGVSHALPEDDTLRRRWQQAATEWSSAFERLLAAYEGDRDGTAEGPAKALTHADEALATLEADIESHHPGAVTTARQLPARTNAQSVRRSLPPRGCLLQYHVVARELVIWGTLVDSIRAHRVRLDVGGIEALVGAFWRACSNGLASAEGERLAQLLLAPMTSLLQASTRVVVVPFGALSALPFHALPFEGEPLGEQRIVSYLPAASLLAGRDLDEPIAGTRALVVGDPAFDPASQPRLKRLPGALVEARAVGGHWSTRDVLLGEAARERELRLLLRDRAVVHMAVHGHLDEIAPSTSALVLAGTDCLTVADLIGLRVGAELVVLSACDSGRGAATLGGDVIGLTRALLAAGVQRAVVSLWPVDDVAACVTMTMFHERLVDGTAPAWALAETQREVRRMASSELLTRYRALGGSHVPGARTARRGGGTPGATRKRGIPLAPEFVDADEPDSASLASLDGNLERIWAPFILVGT